MWFLHRMVTVCLLQGASKEQDSREEFMTHLERGSSLSERAFNWNRKFPIKIGIPKKVPTIQTRKSRWENDSLPTLTPETRRQRSPEVAGQRMTSDFVLCSALYEPMNCSGRGKEADEQQLLNWCHGCLWKRGKLICSARSVPQAQS